MTVAPRIVVYLLCGVIAILAVRLVAVKFEQDELEQANAEYALRVVGGQGFVVADPDRDVVNDLPPGASSEGEVTGRVRIGPTQDRQGGGASGSPTGPPPADPPVGAPAATLCLDEVTADLTCRVELIRVGGQPLARLFVGGRLSRPGEVRELGERLAEEVTFAVERGGALTGASARRFGWTVGVGGGVDPVSRDGRVIVGAMWGWRVR